ncbi:MAG: adenylyl cyclase, partial [Proteobacteria bacterium]|nr:adenylyl cyclase [Pseudomonadota bacterium]
MALMAELKRRRVFRVAAMYGFTAWIITEVSATVFPALFVPDWAITFVVVLLIIGFPIAMFLAWNYERSPEGFVRTTSRQSWQNPYSANQKKPLTSSLVIVGLILVIIVMYIYPQYLSSKEADTEVTFDDKSIAVLPFVDMSPEGDQEYLGDGLAEGILNLLTKIPELNVISRTSAFSFKGQNVNIPTIAQKLGVNHILEGSVQKSGETVRITVQLIEV